MKKLLVIALAVILVVSAVCVLAACGNEEVVEGEYSYANAWNSAETYGCKVKVTVKGGVITAIEVTSDTATYYNLSPSWENKATWQQSGQAMIDSFVGLKVDDVNKIQVKCDTETNTETHAVKGQPQAGGISGAPSALKVVTGATQSSGRLILAVQNALSKLSTAK